MYSVRLRYPVTVSSRLLPCAAPVLRSPGIFTKAIRGNVFSELSVRFAGYALTSLVLLFVVSPTEASSARFFQQQAGDGKAASANVEVEDAHDGVSRTVRITGRVPCVDGEAAGYPCKDMDLLAVVPREDMTGFPCPDPADCFSDIWGWTDPVTRIEYALLARVDGVAFFDLSDPENPSFVGMLPMTPGSQASWWRDVKVVNDHAVIVADFVGPHGMQVFDLSQLRDVTDAPATFEPTALYDAFGPAHNVVVHDETDHVYIVGIQGAQQTPSGFPCGAGPHIVDMSDPAQPTFAGCYHSSVRGITAGSYTHDAQCVRYSGPDTRHQGKDICFSSDETGGAITDVTNPASPEELGVFGYPNFAYTHQGWLTEDHRYLFVNDELDEDDGARTRTMIFDVQELDDPVFVGVWHGPTTAIDHNLYIRGDKLYEANYTAGLRVMDISYDGELSLDAIREVAYFDVLPQSNRPNFAGSWSSYPYFESGIIAVSSMNDGLFILAPPSLSVGVSAESEELPAEVALLGNYPNPFNPETMIRYALPQSSKVRLAVYDLLGQEVAVLVDGSRPAGHHTVRFDGGDLPSGSYVYRLQVGEEIVARTMALVK
ncbi:MAG: choice-of-anchor B family protein [Bacteroidetes bacterium SB0662_bin_6]|nr:choice-of-anchor B family protein [Bacteroidetes bacterium SB0668_bin_1]MYE04793.1 choice-of-anchor B family protein [Bacteroidetes bacterium SB0662_bin_6]